jgi:hypothetical protein
MLRVLFGLAMPPAPWESWYPAGQRRMILQGLFDRGLIDRTEVARTLYVTDDGWAVVNLARDAEIVDVST